MLLNILVIAGLIALDQVTKYLATMYLAPVGTMPLLPGVMELQYYLNDGAAFSLLSGVSWGPALLLCITGVVLAGMTVYLFWKKPAPLVRAALLLVISGGFGNFIDRALNGVVVDFFSPTFIQFAVFNVADIFVCTGVGLLFLAVLLDERAARRKAGPPAGPDVPDGRDAAGGEGPCGDA